MPASSKRGRMPAITVSHRFKECQLPNQLSTCGTCDVQQIAPTIQATHRLNVLKSCSNINIDDDNTLPQCLN
jgi:hypothetical protein